MNFKTRNGNSEVCCLVLAFPHRKLRVLPLDQLVKLRTELIAVRFEDNNGNINTRTVGTNCRLLNLVVYLVTTRTVFLNRRAAARYRALASIIRGRERFSWNLSF